MKSFLVLTLLLSCLVAFAPAGPAQSSPSRSLVLPPPDPELQAGLDAALDQPPFRKLIRQGRLSVALVDLSNGELRFSGVDQDKMRYAASLPKIAVLLAVFEEIDAGRLEYTPQLQKSLARMIRFSSNRAASDLIALVGFERIAEILRDPAYELYDPRRKGGLWVGKDYGGSLGRWKRDPLNQISHGATARQVARFLVMLEEGLLVSPRASQQMKEIMSQPGIRHKFVKGLASRPDAKIFRKSGSWRDWHSDAAIVEAKGRKYVAVALMESSAKNVLSRLIVALDDLIQAENQEQLAASGEKQPAVDLLAPKVAASPIP